MPVLAGQHAAPERGGGEQPDPGVQGGGQGLTLDAALQQRVLQLRPGQRHPPVMGVLPGGGLGQLPAAEVADADVAGPARGDGDVEGAEGLLDGGGRVEGVDLPEVDVVGAEPAQRGVERGEQVPARAVEAAGGRDAAGLGGDDQVGAGDETVGEPGEQVLGVAVGVDVGGVDEVPAGVDELLELFRGHLLVGGAAPGHGAEAEPGDLQPGAAEVTLFHRTCPLTGRRCGGGAAPPAGTAAARPGRRGTNAQVGRGAPTSAERSGRCPGRCADPQDDPGRRRRTTPAPRGTRPRSRHAAGM